MNVNLYYDVFIYIAMVGAVENGVKTRKKQNKQVYQ